MVISDETGSATRIDAAELAKRLDTRPPPVLLDVRRGEALDEHPGIPDSVPLELDRDPLLLPDLPRAQSIVVYCL